MLSAGLAAEAAQSGRGGRSDLVVDLWRRDAGQRIVRAA